jgi:hypothetical protein
MLFHLVYKSAGKMEGGRVGRTYLHHINANQRRVGNWGALETTHEARHKIWVGRPHHLGPVAPTISSQTEHLHAKSHWFESLTQLVMLSYGYPIYLA